MTETGLSNPELAKVEVHGMNQVKGKAVHLSGEAKTLAKLVGDKESEPIRQNRRKAIARSSASGDDRSAA